MRSKPGKIAELWTANKNASSMEERTRMARSGEIVNGNSSTAEVERVYKRRAHLVAMYRAKSRNNPDPIMSVAVACNIPAAILERILSAEIGRVPHSVSGYNTYDKEEHQTKHEQAWKRYQKGMDEAYGTSYANS